MNRIDVPTIDVRTIEVLDDNAPIPLGELIAVTHIERSYLVELVEVGIVSPTGDNIEQWTFLRSDLRRVVIAQRLIADLNVNAAGAALALDLLAERDSLLRRIDEIAAFVDES